MTSTVIDSLVISLGLDAKGVVKGAQQTEGALKRLRARLTDNAKGIEQAHTRVAESVRNVREQVLGLLTVVTAGRGLNAFFQETSANVIATRNFSQTIDTSTASLGKWEAAARMAGGSAEGIRQTFASISSSIAEWDLNKTFSSQLQQMQRSGIAVLDGKTGNALSTEQIFKNALRYLSTIKDMRRRTQQARSFGFGDSVLPLVNSGSGAIQRMLHEAQEDGAEVTEKQTKANAALVHSQERLKTSTSALGRQIESDFAPQMTGVNDLIRATNLPYLRLQGGKSAVIVDPAIGDIGLAVFASRDISSIKQARAPSGPGSHHIHSWSDGLYIGGFLNGIPEEYIWLTGNGVKVRTKGEFSVSASSATFDCNISTSGDVKAGSISLTEHTHSGVQRGGGTTDMPE